MPPKASCVMSAAKCVSLCVLPFDPSMELRAGRAQGKRDALRISRYETPFAYATRLTLSPTGDTKPDCHNFDTYDKIYPMPIEKSKKHFLGKDGHERLNCADAILTAFGGLDESDKEKLCRGGGRSPDGECGALCAAKSILAKTNFDLVKEMEDEFIKLAGSKKCNEIRRLKKLSCLGCVEKAAELLHAETQKP